MIEIRELSPDTWKHFEDIFREEFGSDLPPETHAQFFGIYDDDSFKGFILCEDVKFIGQIFMFDASDDGAKYARALISHVRHSISPDQSVATVASEPRFEKLFRSLGMQKIAGILFRRG